MDRTHLLLEGVAPDDVPTEFLVAVMDAADACDLDPRGISIRRPDDLGQ